MIEQSLSGAVLFLLIFASQKLLKRKGLSHYFSFLWLSFFMFLIFPIKRIVSLVLPQAERTITTIQWPSTNIPMASVKAAPMPEAIDYSFYLAMTWTLGIVISLAFTVLIPILQQYRMRKRHQKIGELRNDLLSLGDSINLFVVNEESSPFTYGFLKPFIVLPKKVLEELSKDQINGIIQHERAHVLNYDLWKILFSRIVSCIFWMNPLVYIALFSLRESQEYEADHFVQKQEPESVKSYASALVQVSQMNFLNQEGSLGVSVLTRHHLTRRLEMIIDMKRIKKGRFLNIVGFLTVAIFFSVSCVKFQDSSGKTEFDVENNLVDTTKKYVTITADLSRKDGVLAHTTVISEVGSMNNMLSHTNNVGSYISFKPTIEKKPEGEFIDVSGFYCAESMTESIFNYRMRVSKDFNWDCTNKVTFRFKTVYGYEVKLNFVDQDINAKFVVYKGAQTGKVLSRSMEKAVEKNPHSVRFKVRSPIVASNDFDSIGAEVPIDIKDRKIAASKIIQILEANFGDNLDANKDGKVNKADYILKAVDLINESQ
ncbi:MAG: M56 family metallopeptidase [Bdellovibrionales bacterium]|nr:M56 family metallopeptidase [Bdellovibrionales bacterium]